MPSISTNCRPHQKPEQFQSWWDTATGRAAGAGAIRTVFGRRCGRGTAIEDGTLVTSRTSFAATATSVDVVSSGPAATSVADAGIALNAAITAVAAVI